MYVFGSMSIVSTSISTISEREEVKVKHFVYSIIKYHMYIYLSTLHIYFLKFLSDYAIDHFFCD